DNVRTDLQKATQAVSNVDETIERLLVTANPEQLRKKLEDVVDLAGHRILSTLRAQFDGIFQAADGFFQRLKALETRAGLLVKEGQKRLEDAAHEGEEALLQLEKLFALADEAAGEARETVETVLQKQRGDVLERL